MFKQPFNLPPSPSPIVETGRKFDKDKPQYSLLPDKALLEMVKNLTFGASKYAPNNWRKLANPKQRYFDAAQRHMWQWFSGEQKDPENNLHHLAAAAVNMMFILDLEMLELEEKEGNTE
jgi:hypothetical protein